MNDAGEPSNIASRDCSECRRPRGRPHGDSNDSIEIKAPSAGDFEALTSDSQCDEKLLSNSSGMPRGMPQTSIRDNQSAHVSKPLVVEPQASRNFDAYTPSSTDTAAGISSASLSEQKLSVGNHLPQHPYDSNQFTITDRGLRKQELNSASRPTLSRTRSVSLGPGPLSVKGSSISQPSSHTIPSRKRHADPVPAIADGLFGEPASKKPRHRPRKHILNNFDFIRPPSPGFVAAMEPPSPLFFSHSRNPRPPLPPRFSSSEAAAKMLSSARAEESPVKTVSLARGLMSTQSSPYIPTSTPKDGIYARHSTDRSSLGRSASPDSVILRELHDGIDSTRSHITHILNSIGIVELLEQDERPTFIVDLADSSNYGSGPLNPVYVNASFRSYSGFSDIVSGATSDSSSCSQGLSTHLQYKSWLLSSALNGESLPVCLPAFSYANLTWTCSTLRKRLRIISGTYNVQPVTTNGPIIPNPSVSVPSLPSASKVTPSNEANDYFSHSVPSPEDKLSPRKSPHQAKAASNDVFPTIEVLGPAATEVVNKAPSPTPSSNLLPELQQARGPDLSDSIMLLHNASVYVKSPPRSNHSDPDLDALSRGPNTLGSLDWSGLPSAGSGASANSGSSTIPTVPSDAPSFDWTRLPISDSMPQHIQFARSIAWETTSLGPIETWSSDLRQMCNLVMASPHPAAMYWGEDLVAIYNEAYIFLAGQKHPKLMGQTYRAAWAEIWDDVKDVFEKAMLTGEATMKDDDCLFINRTDQLEETYFSWSIIPMVGSDGSVMGLYNPAFEKTRRKIAERRMLTLREVGERTAIARDVKAFWREVLNSWDANAYDSPFLLLYSVTDENDSDTSSVHSNSVMGTRQCVLEGSLGVREDHPAAPRRIDVKSGTEGFGPLFREAIKTDKPLLLEVGSKDLPESLLEGLELRGFGDPVKAVVICPIHPTTGENILGFLVIGVNPRRPYDDDYGLFIQLLSRQLATSLASVVLFEEEIRRGQRAAKLAALDRIELSQQLAARTREAIESETKFSRMAEFAPVGMFITGSDGRITFANDAWYDISQVPKNKSMADSWMESVHPDDLELVQSLWNQLVVETEPVSTEFRFRAEWLDRNGLRGDRWVLFSAIPERYFLNDSDREYGLRQNENSPMGPADAHNNGPLKSIFGVITNISQQKWAEGFQRRRMEEAIELKRQQENFIDITSHEMRNPLSAILQCADEITQTMTRLRTLQEQRSVEANNNVVGDANFDTQASAPIITKDVIANCLDSAQTISLCSQHQKRIVDDILTLSKLDSQLLLVTPVDARPLLIVQRALKMHEGELQAADIQMEFVVDQSFRDLRLDWVRFDPSRVLQVLINLTTNAIKFTTTESKRTITVTIAASLERPSQNHGALVNNYFPAKHMKEDITTEREWGNGEKVYIHFAVKDTGRGLSSEEKKLLFLRFSQASPRTHVQYGGSGLGLFISRELTELQGGEIGVESEAGKGSTFAFYVAARRSPPSATTDGDGLAVPTLPKHQRTVSDAGGKKPAPERVHPSHDTTGLGTGASPSGKPLTRKVLIVEDNLVNQRVLRW